MLVKSLEGKDEKILLYLLLFVSFCKKRILMWGLNAAD